MKIRTLDQLHEAIDAEMAWRKRELTAIKANVFKSRSFAQETALRSGIALLYAHWEGSVKNIATFYLQYVSNLSLPYCKLKLNFLAISVKSEIDKFRSTNKASLQTDIVSLVHTRQNEKSRIPQSNIIRANSNLNSTTFSEIMASIGLCCSFYEPSYTLIDDVLLNMRNKIAHGGKLDYLSLDEERYNEIHEKIFIIIRGC